MIRHKIIQTKGSIIQNTPEEGESLETKISRIVTNNEPITDGAPIIYMDRGDGIKPEFDVRTDRWDIALDAMDKVTKSKLAKREERHKPKDGEPVQIQGTEPPKPAA